MTGPLDEGITAQEQRRHKEKYRDQADGDAFCKRKSEIRTDLETHEHEREKTDDGGQTARGNGRGGFAQRIHHSGISIRNFFTALFETVDQKDRIIQRYGELKNAAGGVGDKGDFSKDQIGAAVDCNRDAQSGENQNRFHPRGHGQSQDKQDKQYRDAGDAHDLRDGIGGCGGSCHRTAGHGIVIADNRADFRHCGDPAVLFDGHAIQRRVVFVVGLNRLLRIDFKWRGDVDGIIQPHDIGDTVHLFELFFVVQRFGDGDVADHHAGVGDSAVVLLLHYIERYGGGGILRQVVVHVVVDRDGLFQHCADRGGKEEQNDDPFSEPDNSLIKRFHWGISFSISQAVPVSMPQRSPGNVCMTTVYTCISIHFLLFLYFYFTRLGERKKQQIRMEYGSKRFSCVFLCAAGEKGCAEEINTQMRHMGLDRSEFGKWHTNKSKMRCNYGESAL